MVKLEEINSERLHDKYYRVKHKSGLKVYIYPKEGYNSSYAILGAKVGSIDTTFKIPGKAENVVVPDGIAHYLEHKLFESEEGDAFAEYAKTGASANAYTSFDMTGYLFSCTEDFDKSLKILIDFVQSPYFTEKTVKKEQGIIGQEIKMYEDDPSWQVMFNLLKAMYHNHPVKKDIAGTVESIAKINADNLYEVYNNFYNLNNMTLCIAGKVNPVEILNILDEKLKPSYNMVPETIFAKEPYEIVKQRVEQRFPISMPLFQLGFKENASKGRMTIEESTQTDIILSVLASKSSKLYNDLINKGLINDSFGYECFEGPGYLASIFSGESRDPDKVAEIIKERVTELHAKGIAEEDFERAKKSIYGKSVSLLNSAENIANVMLTLDFADKELFEAVECIANTSLIDVNERLKSQLDVSNCSLSVVAPEDGSLNI